MATLPSVNPGALSYALRSFLGEVLSGAQRVSSPMVAPTTRSILVQRQLCTAVSKPFISQKRLPVDLVFIYVSKYIAGSLLFCFPSLPLFLLLPSPLSLTPPLSLSLSLSLSFSLLREIRIPVFACTLLEKRSKSSTGTRDCVNFPPGGLMKRK